MELIIYAPKEDGFIKNIEWNFDELKKEITERASDYMNLVYSDDQIQEAKKDRASLNKFKKALDDKRKEIKKQVMDPYTAFEAQIKELIGIIDKAVNNIDSQVKGYEEGLKQEKEKRCRELFDIHIGDLNRLVPYDVVFNPKWMNKTYTEKAIIEDIKSFHEKVDRELKAINLDMSQFVFEMKEEYLKTFDLSAAMAKKQELEEAARKKAVFEEQERQRKAEEERRLEEQVKEVLSAGRDVMPATEPPESPQAKKEKPERIVVVTFKVIARESQFGALNDAIAALKENSESVEMISREELTI